MKTNIKINECEKWFGMKSLRKIDTKLSQRKGKKKFQHL